MISAARERAGAVFEEPTSFESDDPGEGHPDREEP